MKPWLRSEPELRRQPATYPSAIETWLLRSVWTAVILPAAMLGVAAVQSHQAAFRQGEAQIEQATRLATEHALRVLYTNQLAFDRVTDILNAETDLGMRADAAPSRQRLEQVVRRIPGLRSLSVWDTNGRLLASSNATPTAAREKPPGAELIRAYRPGSSEAFFFELQPQASPVSPPGRPQGEYRSAQHEGGPVSLSMTISQRRERPDGMANVIVAAWDPAHFSTFYSELTSNTPGLSVTLFRPDGTIITRMPPPPTQGMTAPASGPMMQRVLAGERSGRLTIISPIDGKRRLIAFRQIGDHPLYTSASLSHEAVRAGWWASLALLAAFTFPMALALVLVSWFAVRKTLLEYAALRELSAEADRRLKAEAALRQSQKLEALGHLTGGVAHDVNNLLAVVNNNAHLLERLPGGADISGPLASIKRAVAAGTRLTRQLLAFSRRQALHAELLDLRSWLPSVIELLGHSVNRTIEIRHEVALDVRPVMVDPAELELALINLAVNARDAMPNGGTLRVAVFNAAPDPALPLQGDFVEISVSDSGAGIPPDVLPHVFEPFYTTKEMGKGTGLGLSQVYGLCSQAGGTAVVRSRVGIGTTVSMYLRASDVAPGVGVPVAPAGTIGRVLLVDDNPDVAQATALLLTTMGFSVLRAESAAQAMQTLSAPGLSVDVVLSDIAMPGQQDGLGLALSLRRDRPDLGVVLMTGYTARLEAAMAAGFEVVSKPCSLDSLNAALKRARHRSAEAAH